MSALINAKLIIDNIVLNGHNYKDDKRLVKKLLIPIQCLPCICFSVTMRILLCPIQCLFNEKIRCNPCFSLLVDSSASMSSDKCICDRLKTIDERITIKTTGLSNEDMMTIISYATEKILSAKNIQTKYAISDLLSSIMYKCTYNVSPTPDDVLRFGNSNKTLSRLTHISEN